MIDEELVRCRPCGYVMKAKDLGDVCPACGLPNKVFEPYREKVSVNRLFILGLDIHPIAIHLSQTLVALVPALVLFHTMFPHFQETIVHSVITFSVYLFPLTLVLSFISGILDGLTRFKTLQTPLLKSKIVYGIAILAISIVELLYFTPAHYDWLFVLLSLCALACAVKLGLLGKHLLDVILPGAFVWRKKKPAHHTYKTSEVKVEQVNEDTTGDTQKNKEDIVHEE